MLFAIIKAPFVGLILGLVISAVVFWLEGAGNILFVYEAQIWNLTFYWSWLVFLASTAVSFGVLWMTD